MTENERVQKLKQLEESRRYYEAIKNVITARFPRASRDFIEVNPQIYPAQPEQKPRAPLVGDLSRKEKSPRRITVRYRLCRVRPLDFENAPSGTKPITDALRRCGLIPGDSPEEITYQLEQEKVRKYSEERTEIEIVYP
jgi:hypothetical protein